MEDHTYASQSGVALTATAAAAAASLVKKARCEAKRRWDLGRNDTRVNIGPAFPRWRALMAYFDLKTDVEVACFLLDSFFRGLAPSTSTKGKTSQSQTPEVPSISPSSDTDRDEKVAVKSETAEAQVPEQSPQHTSIVKEECEEIRIPLNSVSKEEMSDPPRSNVCTPNSESSYTRRVLLKEEDLDRSDSSPVEQVEVSIGGEDEENAGAASEEERETFGEEPVSAVKVVEEEEEEEETRVEEQAVAVREQQDEDWQAEEEEEEEEEEEASEEEEEDEECSEDERASAVKEERNDPDYIPGLSAEKELEVSFLQRRVASLKEESAELGLPSEESTSAKKAKKVYACPTCAREFPRSGALRRHQVIHSGKRPFKCFICGRGFTQSGNLKTHMKVHKGEAKNWTLVREKSPPKESAATAHICGVCGTDFPRKEQLEEHRDIHKKQYTCTTCGKAFKAEAYLRLHESTHSTEIQFVCSRCRTGFSSVDAYRIHMRMHIPVEKVRCGQCGRAISKPNLKAHLQTHKGERLHLCAVCGKSYSRADTLKAHLRVHTGERPYACERCGKGFYYYQGYKAHIMIHDKTPKPPTRPLGRPKRQTPQEQN